jgi:mannose/fructose-specific phosphotransferase system component IIA
MRVLLVTHGSLGECLLASAARIYGEAVGVDCLSNEPYDASGLSAAIEDWLGPDDIEALILVNVGGGSCGAAARLAADGRKHTWILGGVNLPMVLTCLGSSDAMDGKELVSKILDRALNSVSLLEPLG